MITEDSPAPITATSRIDSSTGGNAIQMSTSAGDDTVGPAAEEAGEQTEQRADEPASLPATIATVSAGRLP